MSFERKKINITIFGLNSFILKIIALITMTVDHVGVMLYPKTLVFRIVGRIAYPIFAYVLAVGSVYTRKPFKRILLIFALACLCEVGYIIYSGKWYGNILITFTFSTFIIAFLRMYQKCKNDKKRAMFCILTSILGVMGAFLLDYFMQVDYGFLGVLFPVVISIPYIFNLKIKTKKFAIGKLAISKIFFVIFVFVVAYSCAISVKWYMGLSIPFILLYNGEKGKYSLKYIFYLYYPIHMLIIGGINMFLF